MRRGATDDLPISSLLSPLPLFPFSFHLPQPLDFHLTSVYPIHPPALLNSQFLIEAQRQPSRSIKPV